MNFANIKASLHSAKPMPSNTTWKKTLHAAVGGAIAAGFEREMETLLVVSSSGQGVYDCRSGQRLYRNRDDSGYNPDRLEAVRLDNKNCLPLPMAGLDGGGLRLGTSDGWSIDTFQIEWPTTFSILQEPYASIFDLSSESSVSEKNPAYHLIMKSEGLPRAFGFSWTGRSLIWMDSSELIVWSR